MRYHANRTWFVLSACWLATLSTSAHAVAGGGSSAGGGDLCEDRIKVIRDDINSWIHLGGPSGLTLPKGISVQLYSDQMVRAIGTAKIRCVGVNDPGYPVQVNGTPKECRFDESSDSSQITCDSAKFGALNESDQYVLIHHEFAGIAGIEIPNGDDSNYIVSNQISGYLMDQVVKRLAIKPNSAPVCTLVNLRNAPVGTKCVTSKGAAFERVSQSNFGEAWKGPDGLIWSDGFGYIDVLEAAKNCGYLGGDVPSPADFMRGEANGFREVLPKMTGEFWTSEYSTYYENESVFMCDYGTVINRPSFEYHSTQFRCVTQ